MEVTRFIAHAQLTANSLLLIFRVRTMFFTICPSAIPLNMKTGSKNAIARIQDPTNRPLQPV